MQKFFNVISRNLVFIVPLSMSLGFVCGMVFSVDFLRLLVTPCAFLMVYPMMVNLRVETIFKGHDIKLQVVTQFLNFCVIPFVAFGLGMIFFRDHPHMLLGILFIGLLPSGGGTVPWTGILKGRVESAIKMVAIGPLVGALLAPLYINFLIGEALDIKLTIVVKQIVFIIVLPMIFGIFTRRLVLKKKNRDNIFSIFPYFSTIGIVLMVFIAMALKAKSIYQEPEIFVLIISPIALLYLFNFSISTIIGRMFFDRGSAIALVYGTSLRNLSISLAITVNLFVGQESNASLVVAIAYIIHVQAAAWYAKLSGKIFS